ncbi:MAG: SGNH/GDSL hydrolase family protein [Ruminococcaceae bacterium]|nr:SGNH/GDSL hydrolase family protein [Oscillospiraceae bacterium]
MPKKRVFSTLSLLLALMMLLPLFAACKPKLEANEIAVTWHHGVVTSSSDKSDPCTLKAGVDGYSYSDIIHIPKAGTTLTFTDDNSEDMLDTDRAGNNVFVLSHWIEKSGEWVLQNPGDHYEGKDGRALEIALVDNENAYVRYTYTSSFDNEYVRLCYRSGQTAKNARKIDFAKVYLEDLGKKGTLVSNEAYYKKLDLAQYLAASTEAAWYDVLEELNVVVIGDSYFDDSSVRDRLWIDLLAYKYDMELDNHGISGSTVSNSLSTISNPSHTYHGDRKAFHPMTERLTDPNAQKALVNARENVDIVLFDGGRNDFTREVSLGAASLSNQDKGTFCGAVNYCIDRLQELFPNALIIGITVWGHQQTNPVTEHTQADFGNAMIEMCRLQGIPCFNGMDESVTGVHMDDPTFRQRYCKSPTDISHLNEAGMKGFMPVMEKYLADQYTAFLASKS